MDKELLSIEISRLEPENISPERKVKEKISHFRELSEEDFQKAIDNVYDYLLRGAYKIISFLDLSLYLTFFYDHGIISEDPRSKLKRASEIVLSQIQSDEVKDYFIQEPMRYDSAHVSPAFREIKTFIKESLKKREKDHTAFLIKNFFSALLNGDNAWVLYKEVEHQLIFLYIDPEEFVSSLVSAPSSGLSSLSQLFRDRYLRISNICDFLSDERPILSTLLEKIKKSADTLTEKPLRKFLLNEIVEKLEKVIAHLKK